MVGERILIVEDELYTVLILEVLLKEQGYHVVGTASTGDEAIAKANEVKPDLVLMDIILEGTMTGIEAAAHMTHQLNIPFIYLTAYSDEGMVNMAKLTQPAGYIIKPITSGNELVPKIEAALQNRRTRIETTKKHNQISLSEVEQK